MSVYGLSLGCVHVRIRSDSGRHEAAVGQSSMLRAAAAVPMKRYRKRMQQQIGMCIQDTTAPLLQRCSQLAAAGEDTDKRTNEILDDAHNFVLQLADIYDFVSPCFPERYNIFHVIWKQYHEHLAFMLDCVGACAEQLANADILKVCLVGVMCCQHDIGAVNAL